MVLSASASKIPVDNFEWDDFFSVACLLFRIMGELVFDKSHIFNSNEYEVS